jgi:PhnB protein
MADYQQKDFHTVTPYIYGRLDLIEFLKQAFDAEVRFPGTGNEDGFHAEIKIGDSIVMLGIAKSIPREFGPEWNKTPTSAPPPATLYLYVPDVDGLYKRALGLGARSLGAPADMPWGDRVAGISDPYGNKWWIATFKGAAT